MIRLGTQEDLSLSQKAPTISPDKKDDGNTNDQILKLLMEMKSEMNKLSLEIESLKRTKVQELEEIQVKNAIL